MNEEGLTAWIGRTETRTDRIEEFPVRALAATFDRPESVDWRKGEVMPPLWVWLFFLPLAPMSEIGADGHPKRGGFLPPVALERRMWAGSRCIFHAPIRIGEDIERISTISNIAEKTGKAGSMVFVTVRHELRNSSGLVLEEEQDIVYVAMPERFVEPAVTPLPLCDWSEAVTVDPVLLFRFSALTFNGHRIHYDRRYAMEVEKYPGLVMHGPLQALLLFEAARLRNPSREPRRFQFRGLRPLFDMDKVTLNGKARPDGGLDLFTARADGAIGMQAEIHWKNE